MPEGLENAEELKPSNAPAQQSETQNDLSGSSPDNEGHQATDANQEGSAQSSGAETEQGAKSGDEAVSDNPLLDIVRDVVKGKDTDAAESGEGSPPQSKEGSEEEEGSKSADEAEGEKDLSDDDLDEDGKPLPFHKHKRWQEVKSQRDEYRKQAEAYKPDAEQFRQITNFMSEKNLSNDEVAQGFQVMDLVKNQPEVALQYFESATAILRQHLGKELPSDIAEAVDRGEISEQHARELSEARARSVNEQQSRQATQQQLEAHQRAQQQTQMGQAMANAVSAWETQTQKTDPDFDKKRDLIATYAKVYRSEAMSQGKLRTPEDAVRVATQAYEAATKQLSAFTPRKRATDPSPSSSVSAKPTTPQEPSSLLDAVRRGAQMPVGSSSR